MRPDDRAGLLMDTFALARAGYVDPADLVRLMNAYADEDNCVVWDALDQALGGFAKVCL
jgi:hypothetical protein